MRDEAEIEAEEARDKLGIGHSLQRRIDKVKAANYQYASRGDTKMFVDEIERLRLEIKRMITLNEEGI